MAKLKLTDAAIRAAKPRARPYKLSDGRGLHLLITPTGSRLWRMQYRFGGKQKLIAFGSYAGAGSEGLSLEQARAKVSEARALLKNGIDPATQKRLDKIAGKIAGANTFGIVADEYVAKIEAEGRAPVTLDKARWLIDLARPTLAERPIAEIKPAELLVILQKVAGRGQLETARRMRSLLSRIFRFAVATARAESDPAAPLVGAIAAPTVTHRAAILDPKEFGGLLRAIDGYDGQPATHAALKLMALLFPRPGELRQADWKELDLDKAIWVIPASRTKMRKEHRVPLPRQAAAILRQLHEFTGPKGLVFPSVRTPRRPISDGTLNAALRRLGYAKEEATAHGFRSSASTMLNELGFDPDVIEAALAHVDGDAVRRAYNRATYWDQRVELMQRWADHLDTLREGAKVIRRDFGGAA
ncbi:Integrase [Filomicrobium insigne]|uniref:Integrase n=1 Tax=Filomicrobium insigne TaxID=418854 RepID=A0A1H0HM03_9HYPH|nr:integrase arm-type DNA-binding domain-containing protein [Filomicrobium insigne]SDO20137.1 Integrase [Filomicrobium insigne]